MSEEKAKEAKPGTTCEDCRFFVLIHDGASMGTCYANPPEEETVRPTVYESDIACRFHTPEEGWDEVLDRLLRDVDNSLSSLPLPTMVAMDREKWHRLFDYIKRITTE